MVSGRGRLLAVEEMFMRGRLGWYEPGFVKSGERIGDEETTAIAIR